MIRKRYKQLFTSHRTTATSYRCYQKFGRRKIRKTAYKVNNVGDEYIFLNVMNVGQDYTRSSKTLKDGVIDVWEKGDSKIYIKVLI
ncbi:hypothetical protein [Chryseobacterium indoltheticum]|uniref:hypothetical protein n=1 Tax=Chryseobacterium indoltheticum TaxID=254 RepID=UPI003F4981D4